MGPDRDPAHPSAGAEPFEALGPLETRVDPPMGRMGARVEHTAPLARSSDSAERGPGCERFRRESRLRSPQDFARVRRKGKRQQGRWLTLSYARQPAEPRPTRVGFSVSKRVGPAVTRNRVKRRLREAIRRLLWKTVPGWDMMVAARPEAATATAADLAEEVCALLTRARLLR